MTDSFAVIVHACDRYQLLFEGFAYFFHQNWDPSIRAKLYFASEQIDVNLPGFTNIKSGKGEWSDRLKNLLEQIPESHVLYMQEDMWLHKPIKAQFFHQLMQKIKEHRWPLVKLHSSHVYQTKPTPDLIEGLRICFLDNDKSQYLMSHQVSLWQKDFFIDQMKKGEHPWRNERRGTKRLKKLNPLIVHLDYFAENNQPAINENAPHAHRSAYATVSWNATLNEEARPLIDQMLNDPKMREYALICDHRQKNAITHDGKPRPQKKDIFKRTKDYLKELLAP